MNHDTNTQDPLSYARMEYHVVTMHGAWPFDAPEDALKLAAEELKKGNSVHIYPLMVPSNMVW